MPHAELVVTLPDDTWIHDVSTKNPGVGFEVVTAMPGECLGISLVRLDATDPLSIITDIERRDDIDELELLWKQESETLLRIQTSNPLPMRPVWRAGVPLKMPFEIRNGHATWKLTTSDSRLSRLQSKLDELGIGFELESLHEIGASRADQLLTDRQQEVLLTAIQAGYYRTPREATLGEVADKLDISNATCSDILHRAEGHVFHWFTEEHITVAGPT